MKVALDTNVLVYAEGINGSVPRTRALSLIAALPLTNVVVPVQVLGELFRVLTRKAKRPPAEARGAVLAWQDSFPTHGTTASALAAAMDLTVDHGISAWDAVILAVAADAGCRLLLSEDMHQGFTWRGVTIIDPFATPRHPLLCSVLGADAGTGLDQPVPLSPS
ncbi:PIN domain-containing protein [Skermanella rosea]|uniref:PIN domain-containing protein n=1 Tax=Skermanella rosea TaxID=1817965 RepID=UPI0019332FD6|nr:PIN domain-containing protein [Skermanella rosea]UEM05050.1 PIN domain-containing protein [Skermanella rosea]